MQRFQALHARLVTLELLLSDIAQSKWARMPELLVQTHRLTVRRMGQLEADLGAALQQAADAGFPIGRDDPFEVAEQGAAGCCAACLLPAANVRLARLPAPCTLPNLACAPPPAPPSPLAHAAALKLTPAQVYVKKLAAKCMYVRIGSGGGAAIAGLDSNTGRALAAQLNDPGFVEKLESQLRPLRQKLGIRDGEDWSEDSRDYQVRGGNGKQAGEGQAGRQTGRGAAVKASMRDA